MNRDKTLWILAVAFYGFGDTVTTLINLRSGCVELNPLINEYSIIPLKTFIVLTVFLIYRRIRQTALIILLLMVGLIGVLNNVFVRILFGL